MKICICDDNIDELNRTAQLMNDFCNKQNIAHEIDTFSNANVLINKLTYFFEEAHYDLYLLDIIMQIKGIDVAKKIREKDEDAIIIFITSTKDYAVDAFSVRATDYLIKPITEDAFDAKMHAVVKLLNNQVKTTFSMKTESHNFTTIVIEDIVYIESNNRRMIIHLNTFEEVTSIVLKNRFHESIPFDYKKHNFMQCHSSYIVNINCIKSLSGNYFTTTTDELIPISKQYFTEAKKRYIGYLAGDSYDNN